jgi:hypothetical protein
MFVGCRVKTDRDALNKMLVTLGRLSATYSGLFLQAIAELRAEADMLLPSSTASYLAMPVPELWCGESSAIRIISIGNILYVFSLGSPRELAYPLDVETIILTQCLDAFCRPGGVG